MWCKSFNLCKEQPINMNPKIYQVLKFLALLIFSLEILAPAFAAVAIPNKIDQAKHFANPGSNTQGQLLCMFSEELANEEDGEGHKEFTSSFNFEFASSFHFNTLESVSVAIS